MADLTPTPQRMIRSSGADTKPLGDRVELEQVEHLSQAPGGRELRFAARQWIPSKTEASCWRARCLSRPGVSVVVEDATEYGAGQRPRRAPEPCLRTGRARRHRTP